MSTCITIPAQTVSVPSQQVCFTVNAPKIVYQNSWLNQTSAIPSASIFTPSGAGIFRATCAVYVFGNNPSSITVEAQLLVSSEALSPFISYGFFNYGNSVQQSNETMTTGTANFAGYSSISVDFSTTINIGSGTLSYYNVYVTIEQLQ